MPRVILALAFSAVAVCLPSCSEEKPVYYHYGFPNGYTQWEKFAQWESDEVTLEGSFIRTYTLSLEARDDSCVLGSAAFDFMVEWAPTEGGRRVIPVAVRLEDTTSEGAHPYAVKASLTFRNWGVEVQAGLVQRKEEGTHYVAWPDPLDAPQISRAVLPPPRATPLVMFHLSLFDNLPTGYGHLYGTGELGLSRPGTRPSPISHFSDVRWRVSVEAPDSRLHFQSGEACP